MEVGTTFWGDGGEQHLSALRGRVNLRKIPDHDVLLKVFCDSGRHLVAVVTRGRPPLLVTSTGTSNLERSREITCRCRQGVVFTDPARLKSEIDPAARRTVALSRVS